MLNFCQFLQKKSDVQKSAKIGQKINYPKSDEDR